MAKILIVSLIAIVLGVASILTGIICNKVLTKKRQKEESKVKHCGLSKTNLQRASEIEAAIEKALVMPAQKVNSVKVSYSLKTAKQQPVLENKTQNKRFEYKQNFDQYKCKEVIAA